MDKIYEAFKEQGYKSSVILIYDQNGGPPTAEYCKAYKKGHGLKMRVLYDPLQATAIYGDKETSIVSNEAGVIVYRAESAILDALQGVIEDELAAGFGECSTAAVCGDNYCAPTPKGDGNRCAEMCTFGDDTTCPEGKVCYRYDETKQKGFCFSPYRIP